MAALVFLAECTFISCMIHQINTQTRTSATQRLRECEAGRTEHQTNLRKSNRRCKRLNCIESKHTGDNKVFIRNRNSLFSRRNDCSLLPSPAALGRVGPSAAAVGGTLCLLSAAVDSRPLRGRSRCCCCFRRHLFLPTHLSPAPPQARRGTSDPRKVHAERRKQTSNVIAFLRFVQSANKTFYIPWLFYL